MNMESSIQNNFFNSRSNPIQMEEDPNSAFKEEYEICSPVEILGEVRFQFFIFLGWVCYC